MSFHLLPRSTGPKNKGAQPAAPSVTRRHSVLCGCRPAPRSQTGSARKTGPTLVWISGQCPKVVFYEMRSQTDIALLVTGFVCYDVFPPFSFRRTAPEAALPPLLSSNYTSLYTLRKRFHTPGRPSVTMCMCASLPVTMVTFGNTSGVACPAGVQLKWRIRACPGRIRHIPRKKRHSLR